jgi:hypothetical protein
MTFKKEKNFLKSKNLFLKDQRSVVNKKIKITMAEIIN